MTTRKGQEESGPYTINPHKLVDKYKRLKMDRLHVTLCDKEIVTLQ